MVITSKPCVFLDRDGVIVVPEFRNGRSFAPKTLEGFSYFPDTKKTLVRLKTAGYLLIVVTNQPDVGNGITSLATIENMHNKMRQELPIDHIEVCYHSQKDNCHCRKPKAGMLLNSLKKFNIIVQKSFMIGDRSSDIEAGRKLNLKTIFIDHHYQEPITANPDYICQDLSQGVEIILREENA
ncbi:HAD family hydrolase [Coxiella burnetii]|uniref:D,D-heptose 1,7-bisphosphate phosphatase n=1 Tax=Coxiella burnetii (strain Dugway 5J108-111) TaxID=434922 RepID=A9KC89_COXBN|nr:HAD family hydrolase [Coxiella burnetii]ABS77266.1 histidinol-phosphatase [Coxiella burnetii Dugway 5J108-111]ABX77814.1 histidinol-phosphate phosphatase family protein [Coxiella burnetii RSA 331]ACJ20738.1 histidinol-phosphatase [Coxiella burnetii CbuK_Q154]AIT63814.1 D,D-heptose 1,7-bisphosphate phosphatase [Coxiella burnetii str. Namibia]AML48997.1 histidinol phosphate phosphatase [Coxiella burnetii]